MIQQEKKYLSGGINADDAPFVVKEAELINAVNHRFGATEDGQVGYNESVPGAEVLFAGPGQFPLLGGLPLGSAKDEVNNRLIIFYYDNNLKGRIFCYEPATNILRLVLTDSQVLGGLNFSATSLITDAFVINGKVYWTDNNQQPRSLNIDASIKYMNPLYSTTVAPYTAPDQNTIRLIKKTQNLPLMIRKVQSSSIPLLSGYDGNHISNDAFQFCVRYIYRDYERSVIGPFSKLAEYNYKDSPLNAIEIIFNPAEAIHEDVQIVQLCVRYNNIGAGFVIKQWDKANADDAAAIATHNTSAPLRYYFLNNEAGPAIDKVDLNKPFDSIPLKSKTLSLARNRAFFGNNLMGYDSPKKTSLAIATTVFPSSGGILGTWNTYVVSWDLPGARHVTMPAIFIDLGSSVTKRYVFLSSVQLDYSIDITNDVGLVNSSFVYPASVSNSQITLQTASLAEIDQAISRLRRALTGTTTNLTHTTPTVTSNSVLITNNLTLGQARTFKSGSAIKAGIVFYDEDRRKCGVVTLDSLRKTFPARQFSQIAFTNVLSWALSNTDAITQIPTWAYYYGIVLTRNLTTDFFFQGNATDVTYVGKDSDGEYTFNHSAGPGPGGFAATVIGVGIKISEMISQGIGYTYSEGDLMDLYFPANPTVFRVPVIGQYGDWVILERVNLGALDGTNKVLFDLYTPHKESINEGFYEVGEIYEVLNPGTSGRVFSTLSGIINGDTYAISRTSDLFSYVSEAMSPNDLRWKNWWSDRGWINVVDNIGQQQLENSISWSNVLIPGSKTNGLSSFDALDVKDLPVDGGELNKLILSSKIQEEGSVMLAICRGETYSLYLGETQVLDSGGTVAFTGSSSGIIGTVNLLKGSYGTSHPESVKEYRGQVMWFDLKNGCVVQYSTNGLFAVSDYKLSKFFRKYAKRYKETNSPYPVIGGIDPVSEEYLLSLISNEADGFAPNLPTFTDPNEFEMYDGKSKTFGFKLGLQKFTSTYPHYLQFIEYMGSTLYTFARAQFLRHSETVVPNNYYDAQQKKTKLMFLSNSLPGQVKVYSSIAVQANMVPTRAIFYSLDPNEQITDLVAADFVNKEGIYYAPLYRDRLSPNVSGTADQKLHTGDKIRSTALKIQLEFDTSAKKLQMEFVNMLYHVSEGHIK